MHELLRQYAGLVNKNIPINSDWDEELNEISYLRQMIHEDIATMDKHKLLQIDNKWQQQISASNPEDWKEEFSYPREKISRKSWWAWIDKYDNLSPEERRTL